MAESLKVIAEVFSYLLHPSKLILLLWSCTLELSFIICLLVSLASILMYIFGYKKFAKWAPISIGIYTLIQAIGSAL
jgi:hypothetical protein